MPNEPDQPRLGQHGGKRTKGQRSVNHTLVRGTGNRAYTLARLRRDGRHDFVEDISDGRLSAYAAAVLMHYAKRRVTVVAHDQDRNQPRRPTVIDIKSLIA